jgi:hypothetical protein
LEVAVVCGYVEQDAQLHDRLDQIVGTLVKLSDKRWKGVRNAQLEERVINEAAKALERDRRHPFHTSAANVPLLKQTTARRSDRRPTSNLHRLARRW